MSISSLDAINAYGRQIGRASAPAPVAKPQETDAAGGDFGSMVGSLVTSTASTLGQAEQASIRQIAGKGDLIDVVTAMGAAETALDTLVAVRDKVVNAYGEIMRMQI